MQKHPTSIQKTNTSRIGVIIMRHAQKSLDPTNLVGRVKEKKGVLPSEHLLFNL